MEAIVLETLFIFKLQDHFWDSRQESQQRNTQVTVNYCSCSRCWAHRGLSVMTDIFTCIKNASVSCSGS